MSNDKAITLRAEKDNALARRDPEEILRFAIEQKADVGVIERIMVVRTALKQEAAKEAYDRAMAAFQMECPVIQKNSQVMNKDGRSVRYKFATIDQIVSEVKGLLSKHGFSYAVTTKVEAQWVCAYVTARHEAGHSEVSEFKVPIEGDAYMSLPQKYAASLTFAKRYAFLNAFGIMTGDQDCDGKTTKENPPGPANATEKTRAWMIDSFNDIGDKALAYAIDKGLIEPDQPLAAWPLEHVPVTKKGLSELRTKIEAHV